jgi:hypothetical protein
MLFGLNATKKLWQNNRMERECYSLVGAGGGAWGTHATAAHETRAVVVNCMYFGWMIYWQDKLN